MSHPVPLVDHHDAINRIEFRAGGRAAAEAAAAERISALATPPGALGRFGDLAVRLGRAGGTDPVPRIEHPALAVFAGDHGVVATGVTPWPPEVTATMVRVLCEGQATASVLARTAGVDLTVVDVGVASPLEDHPLLRRHRVRAGTADLSVGPAMRHQDALAALDVGVAVGTALVCGGADCLLTGEMGIGNTTASAAMIGALTASTAAAVTGRGTGIDDVMMARKTTIVASAIERSRHIEDPLAVAADVGGLEQIALAGYALAGAAHGVPVLVDGVITLAGALLAARLCPDATHSMIAGHRSTEPGASVALRALDLDPIVDLDLCLGEGTGALLALPILRAAAAVLHDVALLRDVL